MLSSDWFVLIRLLVMLLLMMILPDVSQGNLDSKRLYDDVMRRSGYNRIVRPVTNESTRILVTVGLKLSQLIDVDERNQIMTTNVWVLMDWYDETLMWEPGDYGNVSSFHVPADSIWHPDIVLYNTADGRYELTQGTKATLHSDGKVKWNPPASFKSSCTIDVTYFPFDEQHCEMLFGSWTYNTYEVDINHRWRHLSGIGEYDVMDKGIDLSEYYRNVEWDLMGVEAQKSVRFNIGSEDPFPQWAFRVVLKRKFLFYTVNLIIPLVSHAFLTILVFYLPADSKEKISLCINILLSLTVFFLMLAEIIPSTSLVVPLLGKYLTFTMFLVTASVIVTVITYNVHFRTAATHTMPDWVRKIFLYYLPRLLMMRRPKIENSQDIHLKYIKLKLCFCCVDSSDSRDYSGHNGDGRMGSGHGGFQYGTRRTRTQQELHKLSRELEKTTDGDDSQFTTEMRKAIDGAIFIANHLKAEDEAARTKEDWKYIALVIDRCFLWLYTGICVFGTIGIICQAPMLYDNRSPLVIPTQYPGNYNMSR